MCYSFTFCIFEPKNAPREVDSFLKWIGRSDDEDTNSLYENCKNDEEAIKGITPSLRDFFWDLSKYFPPEWSDTEFGALESQVTKLCQYVFSKALTETQRDALLTTVYYLFGQKDKPSQMSVDPIDHVSNLLNALAIKYPHTVDRVGLFLKDVRSVMGDTYPLKAYRPKKKKAFNDQFVKGISPLHYILPDFSPEYILISYNAASTEELYKKAFYLAATHKLGFIDLTPWQSEFSLWFPDEQNGGLATIHQYTYQDSDGDSGQETGDDNPYFCQFCQKSNEEVYKLFGGKQGYICNECVVLCHDILTEEGKK